MAARVGSQITWAVTMTTRTIHPSMVVMTTTSHNLTTKSQSPHSNTQIQTIRPIIQYYVYAIILQVQPTLLGRGWLNGAALHQLWWSLFFQDAAACQRKILCSMQNVLTVKNRSLHALLKSLFIVTGKSSLEWMNMKPKRGVELHSLGLGKAWR